MEKKKANLVLEKDKSLVKMKEWMPSPTNSPATPFHL